MNDRIPRHDKQATDAWVAAVLLIALLVPVLYFVSLGPIVYCYSGPNAASAPVCLFAYFAPVGWLCERSATFNRVFAWYRSCWERPIDRPLDSPDF